MELFVSELILVFKSLEGIAIFSSNYGFGCPVKQIYAPFCNLGFSFFSPQEDYEEKISCKLKRECKKKKKK